MLLSVLAVCMVGAVASAAASAHVPGWFTCYKSGFAEVLSKYLTEEDCEFDRGYGMGEWERLPPNPAGEEVLLEGTGPMLLAVGVEITCEKVKGEGLLLPEGGGELTEAIYTGCKVVKPTGCGVVKTAGSPNGTVVMKDLPTQLVEKESVDYDELRGAGSEKVLATFEIEKTEGGGKSCGVLPLKDTMKGTSLASFNVSKQELEFEGKSGEQQLSVDGLAVDYEGNIKVELRGGGRILVE
jgi:hypothetical protein